MIEAPHLRGTALVAPLFHAVQAARLFPDSKTLVDMPLAAPPEQVAAAFAALQLPDATAEPLEHHKALQQFCQHWLLPVESDLRPVTIPHLAAGPPTTWLPLVTQHEVRQWADSLYRMWGALCREATPHVAAHPDRHTLLLPPHPRPFIIPGARFRENYYWDSFWVLRGLLTCGLLELAQGVVSNMLGMVEQHGFMPNGLRSYYLNRSQPPLLSQMVAALHAAAPDAALLRRAVPALVQEHRYWTSGHKQVLLQGADGQIHRLSRYWADSDQPRPESYREDLATAEGLEPSAAAALWRELASAAESGWDFSSRWLVDGNSLRSCRTTRVVPADLNAFLYQMERNIAASATELGEAELAASFAQHAQLRLAAIQSLLWDEAGSQWRDLVLGIQHSADGGAAAEGAGGAVAAAEGAAGAAADGPARSPRDGGGLSSVSSIPSSAAHQHSAASSSGQAEYRAESHGFIQSSVMAASNWVPLYCGCAPAGSPQAAAAVASLQQSGLIQAAGLAVSLCETGQQWDWPNSWPPVTCMLLEGCREYGGEAGGKLAAALAQQYLHTAYTAWQRSGRNFEKFDARQAGVPGGGGEYECVDGFGWTNGVALLLLERYGMSDHASPSQQHNARDW